jgi:hypothetical protein
MSMIVTLPSMLLRQGRFADGGRNLLAIEGVRSMNAFTASLRRSAFVGAALLAVVWAPGAAQANDPLNVIGNSSPQSIYAVTDDVALYGGIFKGEGLDVNIIYKNRPGSAGTALIGSQAAAKRRRRHRDDHPRAGAPRVRERATPASLFLARSAVRIRVGRARRQPDPDVGRF